jgi:uncharacterized protein YeaO (DUF488 family)
VSRGVFADQCSINLRWPEYVDAYTQLMRDLYRRDKGQFEALLGASRVVLVCPCLRPDLCHRTVLARILTRLGARYYGEIETWDTTDESPIYARAR